MHTQLRLVDTPRATSQGKKPAPRRRSRSRAVRGRAARQAKWSLDWHLDSRARRVGREGVAAARQALAQATDADPRLRKAS